VFDFLGGWIYIGKLCMKRLIKWEDYSDEKINYSIEYKSGEIKTIDDDDYPLKQIKYPVDYGIINGGYIAEDDDDLDIFVGSGDLFGYITVYRPDCVGFKETKMIYKVTKIEYNRIKKEFSKVLLDEKKLTEDKFYKFIKKYKK